MSKTYTLPSISMAVGGVGTWTDSDWHGYTKRADQSVMQIGYLGSAGITATNILFNPTTLASLRSKTIESIKLVLTITWGTIQASGSTAYPIGYKLNGEDGISANTGNNAWTRSNADSTAASTTVAVGYITSQSASQISVGSTPVTLTYDLTGTSVPKYGYSLGNAFFLTSHINVASSATLIVVTNEVDYSFTLSYNANGGTGAPSAQTGSGTVVGTPYHTFTISYTQPTRDGFFFDGWKVSGGSTLYQPGGSITVYGNTTLYAQWSPASSIISSVTSSVPITGTSTGKVTVNITRYNASYTHDVKITLGSRYTTLTGQGTTAEYIIPTTWLDQIPEATSRVATVEVTTKSGSTIIGVVSSATFTATVPANVVPTVTFTSTDVNTNSTIDGWDVLVQGYSKIKLDVVAAAGSGSSLKSIVFSGDNVSLSGLDTTVTSSILTITGDRTWKVVVTDKRNRSTTATLTRTVYPYAVPAIGGLQAIRCDSSGNESPNEGTYASANAVFSLSDVGGHNTLTSKKIYYKIHTASSWTEGVSSATSGAWNTFGGGNISLLYVYDIKVEIRDAVGNTATAFAEVNSVTGFAVGLKNDRARFGGPVQKAGLQVDWNAEFNAAVTVTNRRVTSSPSSQGWYRVLEFAPTSSFASYDLTGAIGALVRFHITRRYYWQGAETHEIELALVNGAVRFINESSASSVIDIDKIRYITDSAKGYVDIHYTSTQENQVGVDFDVYAPLDPNGVDYNEQFTSMDLVSVVDAPSGETVQAIYTFATNTAIGKTAFSPTTGSSYSPYGECWYARQGKVCHVHVGLSGLTANTAQTVYTLPTGVIPITTVVSNGIGDSIYNSSRIAIYANGVIEVESASQYAMCDVVFICN